MATINRYHAGTQVRISAIFKNSSGVNSDPTSVIVEYKPRDGAVVSTTYPASASIIRSGVGVYYLDMIPTLAETMYSYSVRGTGTLVAVFEGDFGTYKSNFD